ncbi:MAG: hypothetical protein V4662_13085 [Verrucomicrobiota bacterium]
MNLTHPRSSSRLLKAGFSLVETLMATGIVSTTALGTLALLASSMTMGVDGQARSKAMIIAQDIFHDLQSGSAELTPSVLDERQTKSVWPLLPAAFAIPRNVLLFDSSSRPLPAGQQPKVSEANTVYDGGASTLDANWLVVIEGTEQTDFTVDPATGAAPTSGMAVGAPQIAADVDMADFAPLGTSQYDYPAAAVTAALATLPVPKTALTQITISVEAPSDAPARARKKYRYSFLWNR